MRISEIKNMLECRVFCSDKLMNAEVHSFYAADMMSDVLKFCSAGSLLITGLVNIQVVKVAEILDLKGIVFVSGKIPGQEIISKAQEISLPLLVTDRPMFETCSILHIYSAEEEKMPYQNDGTGSSI